jgi:hypothetical protein
MTQGLQNAQHQSKHLLLNENANDPADPPDGSAVLFIDSAGDLKVKITFGGTTKNVSIVDYSAS